MNLSAPKILFFIHIVMKAKIRKFIAVIPAVKASANRVVNHPGNLQAHEKFHKRCEMALKCVAKIQEAFSGRTELELLNPLRYRAREKIGKDMGIMIFRKYRPRGKSYQLRPGIVHSKNDQKKSS